MKTPAAKTLALLPKLRHWKTLGISVGCLLLGAAWTPANAEGANLGAIKSYLVGKVTTMDNASHDFVAHSAAYAKLIADNGGDYNQAILRNGDDVLALIVKMQGDYRAIHNSGYETIEGITAGVKRFVDFDTDLDAGVPKSEASTDSPAASLVLKTETGKTIVDRNGNLFHYVMEPTLWGTKAAFVQALSPEASTKAHGIKVVPKAEVLVSSSKECERKMNELLALSKGWEPTLDDCVGALVWMTPTLNGYFVDWKDSRYNPNAALGRYVAESRVLDMRGIMSSLELTYNAVMPALAAKDAALAKRIQKDYRGILTFLDRVDAREKKGSKLTVLEIEEMAFQAKALTDQLVPNLKQVVALLGLKLPPKPILA